MKKEIFTNDLRQKRKSQKKNKEKKQRLIAWKNVRKKD